MTGAIHMRAHKTPDRAICRAGKGGRRIGMADAIVFLVLFSTLAWDEPVSAAEPTGEASFLDTFNDFDAGRWRISHGWTNGDHQNCTWLDSQVQLADGTLNLIFERRETEDRQYACGEIQTHARFGHGVYEARMRTARGSGLNAAFFTYIGPVHDRPHDEIDIEILTRDTSRMQLNVYVAGEGGNEKFVPLPGGSHDDFNDYAFVWEADRISWYLNSELVHSITDPARLPSNPQKIYLSFWGSDNLVSWMGAFADPGRPLALEIDHVAYTAPGDPCQFPESVAC